MQHAINAPWRSTTDEEPMSAPAWLLQVIQALCGSAATFNHFYRRVRASLIMYRVVRYYTLPHNYKGVIACVIETLNTHRSHVKALPRANCTKRGTLRFSTSSYFILLLFLFFYGMILVILTVPWNRVRAFDTLRFTNGLRPRFTYN